LIILDDDYLLLSKSKLTSPVRVDEIPINIIREVESIYIEVDVQDDELEVSAEVEELIGVDVEVIEEVDVDADAGEVVDASVSVDEDVDVDVEDCD
jgi:hypothetical protein